MIDKIDSQEWLKARIMQNAAPDEQSQAKSRETANFIGSQGNIYGILTRAICELLDEKLDSKPTPPTIVFPPVAEPKALPEAGALMTDPEAKLLAEYIDKHFDFPNKGKQRLVAESIVVMQNAAAQLERSFNCLRTIESMLNGVFDGGHDEAEKCNNGADILAYFCQVRNQIAQATAKVLSGKV